MSRYQVDRVLWEVAKRPQVTEQFKADPQLVLSDRDLESGERDALATADMRSLYEMGAHPFLLYNFALALEGAFSVEFFVAHTKKLAGLTPADITT